MSSLVRISTCAIETGSLNQQKDALLQLTQEINIHIVMGGVLHLIEFRFEQCGQQDDLAGWLVKRPTFLSTMI